MQNKFIDKIKKLVYEKNKAIFINALIEIALVLLLSFSLTWIFTAMTNLDDTVKFFLLIIIKIPTTLMLLYVILRNYNSRWDLFDGAKFIDILNKDKHETYLNSLELLEKKEDYDDDILKKIFAKVNHISDSQNIPKFPIKNILVLVILMFSILGTYFINPKSVKVSWKWYWLSKIEKKKHSKYIELQPGNAEIKRGSSLKIKAIYDEKNVATNLYVLKNGKISKSKFYNQTKEIFDINFDFTYFAKNKFATSDTFKVSVYEMPIILKMSANLHYPKFTHFEPLINKETDGNFDVYKNTKITLIIKTNNKLQKAELIFSNGNKILFEMLSNNRFKVNFIVDKNLQYHFNLIDLRGYKLENASKQISIISDNSPQIGIVSPGRDTVITKDMKTKLKIVASDDFGLKNLYLNYQIKEKSYKTVLLAGTLKNPLSFDYLLDLSKYFLMTGDRVVYWTEISDNNHHKGQSEKYYLRFPSMEEIFKEVDSQEKKNQNAFKKKLKEVQKLKKDVEQKRRDLARKEKVDWKDKKDVKSFLKKQKETNEEMKKMIDNYQKIVKKYEKNNIASDELLKKMKKIKDLMDEISDQKLKDAMKKLQQSMDSISPEMMKKALENFEQSLKDYEKKIDETIKLLEKIKKEQEVNKSQKMMEEIQKQQKELLKKTEKKSENKDNLQEEQKKIEDKLDDVKKQIEKMNDMLKDDKELSKMSEDLKKMAESDSLKNEIQKSQNKMSQGKMEESSQSQKNALKKMDQMTRMLKQMQSMMSAGQQAEIGKLVDDTLKELFILAKLQSNSTKKYAGNPFDILSEQIASSEALKITINKLFSQPMIIMMINPKFVYDYNATQKSFQEMFKDINDNKKYDLEKHFSAILKGFNLMTYDLLQSMSNSQGGGGGMESLMKQLQNMGQQQMMMNMLTQKLMDGMSQSGKGQKRLSQKALSQMRRIAAQEEQLANNLERVLQTNTSAQKQMYSMQKIIDDLKQIANQINRNQINDDIIEKQNRIISRLLDAQKSIHTRDKSKKRKAESADQKKWNSKINGKIYSSENSNSILENEINNFTPEQQALIRKYLNKINEMLNNSGDSNE